jgi:hypothetical protein
MKMCLVEQASGCSRAFRLGVLNAVFDPIFREARKMGTARSVPIFPRILRFQIEGALQMDPSPEHASGEYQLRGDC